MNCNHDFVLIWNYVESTLTDDDAPEAVAIRADKSAIATIAFKLRLLNSYQYLVEVKIYRKNKWLISQS